MSCQVRPCLESDPALSLMHTVGLEENNITLDHTKTLICLIACVLPDTNSTGIRILTQVYIVASRPL